MYREVQRCAGSAGRMSYKCREELRGREVLRVVQRGREVLCTDV